MLIIDFVTVQALTRKYNMAKVALEAVQVAFKDLTAAVGNPLWIQEWELLEAQALERHGEAMMIYNVSPVKGIACLLTSYKYTNSSWLYSSLTGWEER